jgi:hypothetical protein
MMAVWSASDWDTVTDLYILEFFFDKAKEEDESKKEVETEILIMLINIVINNFYRKVERTT